MMQSNLLRSLFAAFALASFSLLPQIVSAQNSSGGSAPTDSKIRRIDGVVAVVNTSFVTRKEIDDRIATLQKQGNKLPDTKDLRQAILDRLIIEKIQLQNAADYGVVVSDKELDRITADIAEKNKLSISEFKRKVEATGTSYAAYKQLLREEVIITRYRQSEVESKIIVSDAEVDNFIVERNRAMQNAGASQSAPAVKGGPEEIDIAQIFIPADVNAGAQTEAKKKADLLLVQARGDIDFMQLGTMAAREDPKIKFQVLGYRTPDRLPQLFYEAIRNTGGGQVANAVVKSPAGFHILKVLDRRALVAAAPETKAVTGDATPTTPQNITIQQTLSRHILLRSRDGLLDQDAERRLAGYRDQVRAKTVDFGELAKKYSDDGSASNGGNLGWMGPGDLVPEFEQTMNRLQIGEVSNPVKTQFGWHIIQVLERRDAQLTVDKQREYARAAIRERKFEQAYQDWLRELRDTATVKIINLDDPASTTR